MTGNPIDLRRSTRARLEAAQDAFDLALRRLRALEEVAAQLHAPLDLEHAHDLWSRVASAPRIGAPRSAATLDEELQAMRAAVKQMRERLRAAEAEAALAA